MLTKEEIETERTPDELWTWFESTRRAIAADPNSRKDDLLRHGLYKEFHEEVCPFAVFVRNQYSGENMVGCLPVLGNDDHDAKIIDRRDDVPRVVPVEITFVKSYEDALRMEYFEEHGEVSMTGKVAVVGTKLNPNRKVSVEHGCRNVDEDIIYLESAIVRAATAKIRCETTKESGYILIVSFADRDLPMEGDRKNLISRVREDLDESRPNFKFVYLVGNSGEVFEKL